MIHPRNWLLAAAGVLMIASAAAGEETWKIGLARVKITPEKPLWMGGYASRNRPAEGVLQDLWIKVMALEDARGTRAVLVTSDLLGMTRRLHEDVTGALKDRYGLAASQIMLTSSHTHCGPVIRDSLYNCYELDGVQIGLIEEYTRQLEKKLVTAVGQAIQTLQPASLSAGEGLATFAVNRRNNVEREVPELIAAGRPLKGPVDHSVPVLAVRSPEGKLLAVVFGYACHNTTLSFYQWCGDYAGFAQANLERSHPGAMALFWQGCGGDQNPLPRRSVELCEKYGRLLAAGVDEAMGKPLRPLAPRLRTAFEQVVLEFVGTPGTEELQAIAQDKGISGRWARRILVQLERGEKRPVSCVYPIGVWRLGDQLWVFLGGETVVDYALNYKSRFGRQIWVTGYANDVMGYIPSHRIWKEGGYESGALREYGQPADQWAPDVEERITKAVERLVQATQTAAR